MSQQIFKSKEGTFINTTTNDKLKTCYTCGMMYENKTLHCRSYFHRIAVNSPLKNVYYNHKYVNGVQIY